jgi:hypothetical protein
MRALNLHGWAFTSTTFHRSSLSFCITCIPDLYEYTIVFIFLLIRIEKEPGKGDGLCNHPHPRPLFVHSHPFLLNYDM